MNDLSTSRIKIKFQSQRPSQRPQNYLRWKALKLYLLVFNYCCKAIYLIISFWGPVYGFESIPPQENYHEKKFSCFEKTYIYLFLCQTLSFCLELNHLLNVPYWHPLKTSENLLKRIEHLLLRTSTTLFQIYYSVTSRGVIKIQVFH